MPLPYYTEHRFMSMPNFVDVCPRCKSGLATMLPGIKQPKCYKCGNNEVGIRFVCVGRLREVLRARPEWAEVADTIEQALALLDG